MPGAIHNYWLGIMALAFALALATWIGLVFLAGRHPGGKAQEQWPRRNVMGGSFTASQGGRQVMPDPREPEVPMAARPPAPREPAEAQEPTKAQEPTETGVRTGRT